MTTVARRTAAALLALTLLAAAAGCGRSAGGGSSSAPPKSSSLVAQTPAPKSAYSGVVTWALYRETNSLDPIYAFDYPENTVLAAMCDTLLRQSPEGVVGPGLATLTYPDPTTLVFTLHSDATFWDGAPVTAADVVYSLDRQRDAKLGGFYGAVFSRVRSITATGANQVTIALTQPDYWLAGELASTAGFIVEKRFIEHAGKKFGTPTGGTMCSGPYKLKSWQPGNELAVTANPGYWDAALRPKVHEIDFKGVPTDAAATAGFLTGEIMGYWPLSISTLHQLQAASNLHVYLGPSYESDAFIVANAKGPLGNVLVRRALSLAIDREGYIQRVYGGASQLPRTLANPGTWGYGRPIFQQAWNALPDPTPNIAAAKKLIKQAGATGKTITIGMSSQLTNIATEAVMFQSAGQQIGLNVRLHSVSAANYIDFFTDPKARVGIDGFFTANYPDYADPAALYATVVLPDGSQNYDGFSDPSITRPLEQARTTADPAERARLVVQAQAGIVRELSWIPVAAPDSILIMNRKITGAPASFSYMFAPWMGRLGAAG